MNETTKRVVAAKVLRSAADLIEEGSRWCQGHNATDAKGCGVPIFAKDATCFCAHGAIIRVRGDSVEGLLAERALLSHVTEQDWWSGEPLGEGAPGAVVIGWNDVTNRNAGEVVEAMREAADKVELPQS